MPAAMAPGRFGRRPSSALPAATPGRELSWPAPVQLVGLAGTNGELHLRIQQAAAGAAGIQQSGGNGAVGGPAPLGKQRGGRRPPYPRANVGKAVEERAPPQAFVRGAPPKSQ